MSTINDNYFLLEKAIKSYLYTELQASSHERQKGRKILTYGRTEKIVLQ